MAPFGESGALLYRSIPADSTIVIHCNNCDCSLCDNILKIFDVNQHKCVSWLFRKKYSVMPYPSNWIPFCSHCCTRMWNTINRIIWNDQNIFKNFNLSQCNSTLFSEPILFQVESTYVLPLDIIPYINFDFFLYCHKFCRTNYFALN